MAKTPKGDPSQRKTQDAVAAKLKRNQQRDGMAPGQAARQNERAANKIMKDGKGLRKSK